MRHTSRRGARLRARLRSNTHTATRDRTAHPSRLLERGKASLHSALSRARLLELDALPDHDGLERPHGVERLRRSGGGGRGFVGEGRARLGGLMGGARSSSRPRERPHGSRVEHIDCHVADRLSTRCRPPCLSARCRRSWRPHLGAHQQRPRTIANSAAARCPGDVAGCVHRAAAWADQRNHREPCPIPSSVLLRRARPPRRHLVGRRKKSTPPWIPVNTRLQPSIYSNPSGVFSTVTHSIVQVVWIAHGGWGGRGSFSDRYRGSLTVLQPSVDLLESKWGIFNRYSYMRSCFLEASPPLPPRDRTVCGTEPPSPLALPDGRSCCGSAGRAATAEPPLGPTTDTTDKRARPAQTCRC